MPDTVRPWFLKDTTLLLTGSPATLIGLRLPANGESGTPLVFTRTSAGFVSGEWNLSDNGTLKSPIPLAGEFIPALGGQNVARGTGIIVNGPAPVSPLLLFPSVSRAGIAVYTPPSDTILDMRIRRIRTGLQDVAFEFTTNAEGPDSIRFGIPQAGLTTPFLADSLFFWVGRKAFVRAKDSEGMYWGKAPFGASVVVSLVERLSVGSAVDTLNLGGKAKVVTISSAGFQVIADSGRRPSRSDFPDMGAFGAAYAFSWPGRIQGDSFSVTLPRSEAGQNAYAWLGSQAKQLNPPAPGTDPITVSIAIGDADKVVFIARKFMIPAGIQTSLKLGIDSVNDLLSDTPGDISLDPNFPSTGLETTRYNILGLRGISTDSLKPKGNYQLFITTRAPSKRDSVHAFVLKGVNWVEVAFTESADRYAVQVDAAVQAVAIVEGLTKADQTPFQPSVPATPMVAGNTLTITPNLSVSEKTMFTDYRIDLASLDTGGTVRIDSTSNAKVDSTLILTLAENRLYSYRVLYRTGMLRYSPDRTWIPLVEKQPSPEILQAAIPSRAAWHQHLIGFPFDAALGANVQAGMPAGTTKSQALRSLKTDGTWERKSEDGKTILKRGEGYLFAADTAFSLQVGAPKYQGLEPVTLEFPAKGWYLFSNPFPMRLPLSSLQFDSGSLSLPQALERNDTNALGKPVYAWSAIKDIRPFEGFLIYAFYQTRVIFNPLAAIGAAAKKAAAPTGATGAPEVRMTLGTPWGSQSAVLYTSGPYRQTPYMAPWSDAGDVPRFRVGGDGGWSYRQVDRLDSLAEQIEITAPAKGVYPLTLVSPQGASGAIRLVDWQTGAILDESAMRDLVLEKGVSRFTLLSGKAVDPGIAAFRSALPADFELDQNYPNPFLGSTRIRIGIPAGAGRVLEARVRVVAMSGRVLEERTLGALSVGSHFLNLGSGSWRPGVYLYEVSLRTDRRALTLRKKMVYGAVAP